MMKINTLSRILALIIILSLITQFLLFYKFTESDISSLSGDPRYYVKLVDINYLNNTFYPTADDLFSDFIFAPGFINYCHILIKLFGSHLSILYANIFISGLICLLLYNISNTLFNNKVGILTVLLFLISAPNQLLNLFYLSQLPYTLFLLISIYLSITFKTKASILAGIAAAVANWFRPFGIFLVISSIFLYRKQRQKRKLIFGIFTGYLITILLLGLTSFAKSNQFIYQSSTMGINMRMGAHPNSTGGYISDPYKDISIKPDMTYKERNKIWMDKSLTFMRNNIYEYCRLGFKKISKFFSVNTYTFSSLYLILPKYNIKPELIRYMIAGLIYFSLLWNIATLIFFIIGVKYAFKLASAYVNFYVLFLFFVIGITILTVGEPLYRHHIIILSYPLMALGIEKIFITTRMQHSSINTPSIIS